MDKLPRRRVEPAGGVWQKQEKEQKIAALTDRIYPFLGNNAMVRRELVGDMPIVKLLEAEDYLACIRMGAGGDNPP
ncbi:MAG: hypothetical protein ACD_69C00081G0001, partial [uncultured bacterium]